MEIKMGKNLELWGGKLSKSELKNRKKRIEKIIFI